MAGFAKTDRFMISDATIMVGAMTDLKKLNVAEHSLGLTKNLVIGQETTKTELTQGLQNDVVSSVITGSQVNCSAEVYEFTAKNLAYGLGLDAATGYDAITVVSPISALITGGVAATTFKIGSNVASSYVAGKFGFLQEDVTDRVHIFKVASSAYSAPDTTVTLVAGYEPPTGMNFSLGKGRAGLINKIDADPALGNKNFAVKIIGIMPEGQKPVVIFMPKVKITKGFSMSFNSENYSNLPFEFSPYVPVPTDAGYDPDFNQKIHVFQA